MIKLPWHVDVPAIRRWVKEMEQAGEVEEVKRKINMWDKMVKEHEVVGIETKDKIGIISLSYPEKGNAFVPPMYKMFCNALQQLEENPDIWVIVIKGTGKSFSTGGFVGSDAFYAGLDSGHQASTADPIERTISGMFQPMHKILYELEKPTITMLNGPVLAEAVDIALATDIRTGHSESDIWFSFGYTGNTAYTGSSWLLPRMVGLSKAKELLITASRIDGKQANELHLINYLFEKDALEDETMKLANRIASLPPITLRLLKKEINRGQEIANFSSALEINGMIEPIVQFTEDHMDAEEAILEKRKPIVRGK